MASDQPRPIVAVDIDGVLRIAPPQPGDTIPSDAFSAFITMRKNNYPTLFHRAPDWDSNDEWREEHWFSGAGKRWVQSLLERQVDVVWATTWHHQANDYFADILGISQLPVGLTKQPRLTENSPTWKARNLGMNYPGRPLLWVDDNPPSPSLERYRRPQDRAITNFHRIRNWAVGFTDQDVAAMDAWLTLASSLPGHDDLRRQRRRRLARRRYARRMDIWGSEARYRAWRRTARTLESELHLAPHTISVLANYVQRSPGGYDADEIGRLLHDFGDGENVPAEVVTRQLREHLP